MIIGYMLCWWYDRELITEDQGYLIQHSTQTRCQQYREKDRLTPKSILNLNRLDVH